MALVRGINSVGRVSASQAECRRFEPGIPLESEEAARRRPARRIERLLRTCATPSAIVPADEKRASVRAGGSAHPRPLFQAPSNLDETSRSRARRNGTTTAWSQQESCPRQRNDHREPVGIGLEAMEAFPRARSPAGRGNGSIPESPIPCRSRQWKHSREPDPLPVAAMEAFPRARSPAGRGNGSIPESPIPCRSQQWKHSREPARPRTSRTRVRSSSQAQLRPSPAGASCGWRRACDRARRACRPRPGGCVYFARSRPAPR